MRRCVSRGITNLQTAHWGVSDFRYSRPYDEGLQVPVGKTPVSHAMMRSVCKREEKKEKEKEAVQ